MVYQCQQEAEIELHLNMHSWVCFIIYNIDFPFSALLWMLAPFDDAHHSMQLAGLWVQAAEHDLSLQFVSCK